MNESRCIVSLGINSPPAHGNPKMTFQDFASGLRAIKTDLDRFGYAGEYLSWGERYPDGAPTHAEVPMGYKPYCVDEARRRGFRQVIWMDASIRLKRPLDYLFEMIDAKGYVFYSEEHSIGQFCKDEALATLQISRDEAFRLPSVWSCVLGLDLSTEPANRFLDEWKRLASDRVTFPGPKWSGLHGYPRTASSDPRVLGHRHDQTAASVLAHRFGMSDFLPKAAFDENFYNDRYSVRRYDDPIDRPPTWSKQARDRLERYARGLSRRLRGLTRRDA